MAKSKKTKIHKKIDGQLLQLNKKFSDLKMKQKDKITGWVYEEYRKYVTEYDKVPDLLADEQIVEVVIDKINEAQIWIPEGEIYDYYRRKKPQLQRRLDNEKVIKFKIIYVFLTIFLYLLKCPQSLILSALRAFCFCGKPHISRSIFLYFRYQAWLKSW